MLAREGTTLPLNQIVCGHAREVMATWPSNSVDLIVTSPPYWNAIIYDGEMPHGSTRPTSMT
jgi:DNA modification methylase